MTLKYFRIYLIGGLFIVSALAFGLHKNIIKLPIERTIHVQYAADFENDKALMGAAHNVFVGKVIKQIGNRDTDIGPETRFAVEVINNIKGDLSGVVTVEQQGGYKDGILYIVEGGISINVAEQGETMLQPGSTYLLATRYNESEKWYTLISHPRGKYLLSKDKILSKEQLQKASNVDAQVTKLKDAYKDEIILDIDIRNNNARNSYKSLIKK